MVDMMHGHITLRAISKDLYGKQGQLQPTKKPPPSAQSTTDDTHCNRNE